MYKPADGINIGCQVVDCQCCPGNGLCWTLFEGGKLEIGINVPLEKWALKFLAFHGNRLTRV